MRQLIIIGILLTVTYSCDIVGDDLESFINKDPKALNDRIKNAKLGGELWAGDPVIIVHELFYSDDFVRKTTIDLETETKDKVVVTLIQEGIGDDSVNGEKRIIEFERINDLWTIKKIKLGFKCQKGRGHTSYSGDLCS